MFEPVRQLLQISGFSNLNSLGLLVVFQISDEPVCVGPLVISASRKEIVGLGGRMDLLSSFWKP